MMPQSEAVASSILEFYCGAAPDHRGRFLHQIQQWPDQDLEAVHDFIQWLFPLQEPSPVNPFAPTLDLDTIAAFQAQTELRARLRASFERMLCFYGFELHAGPPLAVALGPRFAVRAREWVTAGNHNHLRITRILKCLSTLGLGEEARAFFAALSEIFRTESAKSRPGISSVTFDFWRRAVGL